MNPRAQRLNRILAIVIWTTVALSVALLIISNVQNCEAWAGDGLVTSVKTFTMKGRISSYVPGKDGFSTGRISGPGCLGMSAKLKDWTPNSPYPVCAARAGCSTGSVRLGDLLIIEKGTWRYPCWALDTGPYGCLDPAGDWHNCGPQSPKAGKLPHGWKWKSVVDVAGSPAGIGSGGEGRVTVIHFLANQKARRLILTGGIHK